MHACVCHARYYYAELFAASVALIVITALPMRNWKRIRRDQHKKQLAVRMMMFPVVWFICKLPALINRGYQLFTDGHYIQGLTYAHAFTIPSMGFFDAIVFVILSKHNASTAMYSTSHHYHAAH